MHWVWIGTAISSVALLRHARVCTRHARVGRIARAREPTLTIAVTAYDWWWKIDYARRRLHVTTANEIHIPVGEPVKIELKSADVIHAFWVPLLAGKTQTIPGVINEQWIQADRAGVYRGQCTQFCGAQHAHMAFEVIAEPRAQFDAWYASQAKPYAPVSAAADVRAGAEALHRSLRGLSRHSRHRCERHAGARSHASELSPADRGGHVAEHRTEPARLDSTCAAHQARFADAVDRALRHRRRRAVGLSSDLAMTEHARLARRPYDARSRSAASSPAAMKNAPARNSGKRRRAGAAGSRRSITRASACAISSPPSRF